MPSDPLASFTPQVREWFARSFEAPTDAQTQAWPAIAGGEHVLVSAPTGSGKTLAAFLWGLDRLVANPLPRREEHSRTGHVAGDVAARPASTAPTPSGERRTRLVYVSPLKALSYDVEKNLRGPLQGIHAGAETDGVGPDGGAARGKITVAIRTGDTPQRERQAMLRTPPDVLITTPESLYLMLTSRAREFLTGVEWAIVDEIHAVAQTKRGAHLALTLERLDHLTRGGDPAAPGIQRIGLSATQRPLEEVGRFLVGTGRECRIVDTGVRKPLDL
ncbi:MAG TPA: DEAD/DEAH box helicase [Thermoleophilaceae bacterium]|nr:DEAD/DEAH box helicase [Thermoleophilaceae bacterium]